MDPKNQALTESDTPAAPVAKARRGRPKGAVTHTFSDLTDLTVEDFSFVRGVVSGLNPAEAFTRFYGTRHFNADGEPVIPHGHSIAALASTLLERILAAAKHSGDKDVRQYGQLLEYEASPSPVPDLPGSSASVVSRRAIPSIEEWIDEYDVDVNALGEADLILMYKEYLETEYPSEQSGPPQATAAPGGPTRSASDAIKSKVAALNYLQTTLALRPVPSNAIATWLARGLAAQLEGLGVNTIEDLIRFISTVGRHWHKRVPRLGPLRAGKLVAWLESHEETLGRIDRSSEAWVSTPPLRRRVEPLQRVQTTTVLSPLPYNPEVLAPVRGAFAPRPGIAPFELMVVPPHLDGSVGLYRSRTPNHFSATNDYQAVYVWLAAYQSAKKDRTLDAYRREIERFYLWCIHEAHVPLSGVSSAHAMQYQKFLSAIPSKYISTLRVTRDDLRWRPWRGQLDAKSQRYALGVVSQFYNAAMKASYVTGNPFASLKSTAGKESRSMDTSRSLSAQDLDWVRQSLQQMSEQDDSQVQSAQSLQSELSFVRAAVRRRKRLILHLALTTGLRLQEIATSTLARLHPAVVDAVEQEAVWMLEVVGKGNKVRTVPIRESVRRMVLAHHEDVRRCLRMAGDAAGSWSDGFERHPPLVCALASQPVHNESSKWHEMAKPNLALSKVGLYRTLKSFFKSSARVPLRKAKQAVSRLNEDLEFAVSHGNLDLAREIRTQRLVAQHELALWTRRSSISTHWLRHTFALAVLEENPSDSGLKLAQQLLGHASITTTQEYVKQRDDHKIRAVLNVNPLGL